MADFTTQIADYIVKYYSINRFEVLRILEEEWEFLEEAYLAENDDVEALACELLELYMVA
ncbi:MAG: hypothetical protein PHI89_00270 [Thiovulaceae bacterium]|jgi:hypothetical protein|nr:hypothetical protein [Sulfurimonadaceae bacterium]MDD3816507.1 hypothetical protein [Sulfurimonadaceae bacterium]